MTSENLNLFDAGDYFQFSCLTGSKKDSNGLSVATAFSSLSLLLLLSSPLSFIFPALPQAATRLACFSLIQAFLIENDNDNYKGPQVTHYTYSTSYMCTIENLLLGRRAKGIAEQANCNAKPVINGARSPSRRRA